VGCFLLPQSRAEDPTPFPGLLAAANQDIFSPGPEAFVNNRKAQDLCKTMAYGVASPETVLSPTGRTARGTTPAADTSSNELVITPLLSDGPNSQAIIPGISVTGFFITGPDVASLSWADAEKHKVKQVREIVELAKEYNLPLVTFYEKGIPSS